MKKSIFNLLAQQDDLASKIVIGLERISEAFRVLLWEHAKVIGLSPIQIQLLIFIANHDEHLCNVSHLAKEFNLTKATISDAVRVLNKKELIQKINSAGDKRAYSILLSSKGKSLLKEIEHFAEPIKKVLNHQDVKTQEQLFQSLTRLIFDLNRSGILTVQRTCFGCQYYEKKGALHHCRFMEKDLKDIELRLDCPEFEAR